MDNSLTFGSIALFVENLEAAIAFYQSAFGFSVKFYDKAYEFAELDAAGLSLGLATHACGEKMMPNHFPKPVSKRLEGVELAFYTDDVQAWFDQALTAGAEQLTAPAEMPWGQTVAYVRAPDGTVIGLCTRLPESPNETEE
jgi:catechol 2,3-dioxygenase-like lactoylglutathione lyase family enzyme